ncbi:MAG TPA: hypothetical protein VGC76_00355 [Pyrinomonadaceae bacterium]|jgi:hypothetical protein
MRKIFSLIFIISLLSAFGCQKNIFQSPTVAPASLRDVPALRLNFRFESDVPAPPEANVNAQSEDRNAAVQADFDQNRQQELLDKTVISPDKQRVLAVYHNASDQPSEFRLDMYSPDGKLLKKITYDGMAVHFPDTILWSPDSKTIAFVAMIRSGLPGGQAIPTPTPAENQANTAASSQANTNPEANTNAAAENTPAAAAPSQVEQPQAVLTLGTEQIYICGSDGGDLKLVTQNQRLIYFYFVWSPDGSMLAAMAATPQEWRYLEYQAKEIKGEIFVPFGRLRLVEKNGRERLLDDNLTKVRPVWSPDSAKVAIAYETQVRVYDAIGNAPTQAAIPLKNQLLISSKAFDEELQRKEQGGDANAAPAGANTNANQAVSTLPDETSLVSFSPIVELRWTEAGMLYLQTGYVKLFIREAENVRSYMRWHRLIFSPQPTTIK